MAEFETVSKAPYVRGFAVYYEEGEKIFFGCSSCVAHQLRMEALKSLLYGWFSPQAILRTIFFVPWNFFRSFFVTANKKEVQEFFRSIGVANQEESEKLEDIVYTVIAAMVLADGKANKAELASIQDMAPKIIPNFDFKRLRTNFEKSINISARQIFPIASTYLRQAEKELLLQFLIALAYADGELNAAERHLLEEIRQGFGVEITPFKKLLIQMNPYENTAQ